MPLNDPDMPPPSVPLYVIGHLAAVLERRDPGIMDAWLGSLEDEALQREIVRLRQPREEPAIRLVRAEATAWIKRLRLVVLAVEGVRKRAKRRA